MRQKVSGEDGFTLPEALVAMVMTGIVLFAVYAVFDASVRVFGAGRDRMEAVQDARSGLARVERELRAAYPRNRASGDSALLAAFGEEHITFGNDLNGNRRTLDPATGALESGERISYTLNPGGSPLRNGVRLTEFARDIDGDGRAMTFEYLAANGGPASSEGDVDLVRIRLEVSVDRSAHEEPVERVLRAGVALRNR